MYFYTFRGKIQNAVYRLIDPAVRLAARCGVTPNAVTTVGMLGNLAAAVMIACGLTGWGGIVILVSSLLDMVDGYMARTTGQSSVFGAFYDSILDRYSELFTLSALFFFLMCHGYTLFALITLCSLIGSIMVSYVRARAEGLGFECTVGFMQRPERVVLTVSGLLLAGFLAEKVSFDSLWFIAVTQAIIAIFANITAFRRVIHVKKQMK